MELLELMKRRRPIRKYEARQIARADLEKVMEAGLYAPNAGGGQRAIIRALYNPALCEKIGRWNAARMDRTRLAGTHVSTQQPSLINNPAIQSGFYGAPSVCVIFGPQNFLYSVPDAFCCAENMVLQAARLGLASCIVARAEATFASEEGAALLREWGVPPHYAARCFVLLGYCKGPYPAEKPRRPGRAMVIT